MENVKGRRESVYPSLSDRRCPSLWDVFNKRGFTVNVCISFRTLVNRYGNLCRRFVSDDGKSSYLCILNPGNLDMMVLITLDEVAGSLVSACF